MVNKKNELDVQYELQNMNVALNEQDDKISKIGGCVGKLQNEIDHFRDETKTGLVNTWNELHDEICNLHTRIDELEEIVESIEDDEEKEYEERRDEEQNIRDDIKILFDFLKSNPDFNFGSFLEQFYDRTSDNFNPMTD